MAEVSALHILTSTRELLEQVAASRHQSVDQVLLATLDTVSRDDRRRRRAAVEALAVKDDPAELAEIHAIQQDRALLHEA
ncbi:hypothetical protein IV498_16810 [Paenarthrobacter sp. Z7-10]|uniref:hypothetical protein n=1 Tax=Paenarthrobacter sp. Z7-10 TaxID=2787635 RepID=UPI0022A9B58B|nr:hypothetical protein [Paenarthrobacter sp. Z7-10]MCZ2404789.1 hypothetical protein [Paenarthrobacter sp. Z7-10]